MTSFSSGDLQQVETLVEVLMQQLYTREVRRPRGRGQGGHLKTDRVVDVLFYEGNYYLYEAERIESGCLHGAG
ncbi:MAG: hypothetical protein ACP5KC_08245, partial [Infirmifilum sp.]